MAIRAPVTVLPPALPGPTSGPTKKRANSKAVLPALPKTRAHIDGDLFSHVYIEMVGPVGPVGPLVLKAAELADRYGPHLLNFGPTEVGPARRCGNCRHRHDVTDRETGELKDYGWCDCLAAWRCCGWLNQHPWPFVANYMHCPEWADYPLDQPA
jgi:hypothetical protein